MYRTYENFGMEKLANCELFANILILCSAHVGSVPNTDWYIIILIVCSIIVMNIIIVEHHIIIMNVIFLATPVEVVNHYYCFLADNLSNDVFCQILSSLRLLMEGDQVALSVATSEYQRNTLLLNQLLVSDTTSIIKFCHTLQDTKSHEQIGYILVNGGYTVVNTYACIIMISTQVTSFTLLLAKLAFCYVHTATKLWYSSI